MELTTKNGFRFQIDEEDVQIAKEPGWYGCTFKKYRVNWGLRIIPCIRRTIIRNGEKTSELLHRRILNAPSGIQVDHRNGDTLDFRRDNLRLCSQYQNQANRGKPVTNTSGYKGVTWAKRENKWHSQITVNGKCRSLGYYKTAREAAIAYNEAASNSLGEFARLNDL